MKVMSRLGWLMLVLGFCCFTSAQTSTVPERDSVAPPPGYTITLTQPNGSFHLASQIQAKMSIKNTTDGNILWRAERSTDQDGWYHGFNFLLQHDGKEVETTPFHRKISGRQRRNDSSEVWSGSTVLLPKPPGTIFMMTIDLKHLYQISEPGQYTLQVSRVAEDETTIVHSNTVILNVVQ